MKVKAPVTCEECGIIDLLEIVDEGSTFEIITLGWYLCDDGQWQFWLCPTCKKVEVS